MLLGPSAYAVDITLAWDPNTESDLDGYTVYYTVGAPGPPYDYVGDLPLDQLPDPDNPQVTLTDLDKYENYYFALTAYDTDGNESSFSSSLCIYIDDVIQECAPDSVISGDVGIGGGNGGSSWNGACFIGTSGNSTGAPIKTADPMIFWYWISVFAILIILAGPKLRISCRRRKVPVLRHAVQLNFKRPFKGEWP